MIDYDKLKKAHELINKINIYTRINITIREDECYIFDARFNDDCDDRNAFTDIDELIAELEKMTQPKSKYAFGQSLWFMHQDTIVNEDLKNFNDGRYYFLFNFRYYHVKESDLYTTRSALIEAKIQYWQTLLCNDDNHAFKVDSGKCIHGDMKASYKPEVVSVRGVERAVTEFDCEYESNAEGNNKACKHDWDECNIEYLTLRCTKCGEACRSTTNE